MGREQAARVTWGLLVVWVGLMLLLPEPRGVAPLGAGLIVLASGAYHRSRGWPFGTCLWALGAVFVVVGVTDLLPLGDVPWLPIVVIAVGVYLLYCGLAPRRA